VVVYETQFIGSNPSSALELCVECGLELGWLAGQLPQQLHLIGVSPPTWQSLQKQRVLRRRAALDREDGIKLALSDYENNVTGQPLADFYLASKALREGMASAHGIGRWWLAQC
jgi:hypothetical protein